MGKKILIADPSGPLRRNVAALLSAEGYDCSVASDGLEALTKAFYDRPDLILVDPEIGGINGPGLCQALKTDNTTALIPVLFISAKYSTTLLQAALESGAMDYLQKPLEPKVLFARLMRYLSEKYVKDQEVFVLADDSLVSFPTKVTSVGETTLLLEKPRWGAQGEGLFKPGVYLEVHHAASDFNIYRRRAVFSRFIEGEPQQLEVLLASGVYLSQRRQLFRRPVELPARYKTDGGFFRLATLLDVGGAGFRIAGLHQSLDVGTEIQVEFKIPTGPITARGRIVWRTPPSNEPVVAGVKCYDTDEPKWRLDLLYFLFRDLISTTGAVMPIS